MKTSRSFFVGLFFIHKHLSFCVLSRYWKLNPASDRHQRSYRYRLIPNPYRISFYLFRIYRGKDIRYNICVCYRSAFLCRKYLGHEIHLPQVNFAFVISHSEMKSNFRGQLILPTDTLNSTICFLDD